MAEPEPEPEPGREAKGSPEGMARSYLTGEWMHENNTAAQRPLAVMLGDTKIATPQYGITDADVIYESAVEGQGDSSDGRFFQDYANLEKVYLHSKLPSLLCTLGTGV